MPAWLNNWNPRPRSPHVPVRSGGIPILWLLLLSVCFASAASADSLPQYASRLWQMEDGLPHTIVQALAQTRNGYLWVGTREGLARFDGARFTPVKLGNRLLQPSVVALLESKDGALWIGTENAGLFRLTANGLQHFGPEQGMRVDDVQVLAETKDGVVWMIASGLHIAYGAKDVHYDVVIRALLRTLSDVLTHEFDAATREAWNQALQFVAAVMKQGAARVNQMAAR